MTHDTLRFRIARASDSPCGVDGAVDTLAGAEVGKVQRPDDVGPHCLRTMALAPVHVGPPRLQGVRIRNGTPGGGGGGLIYFLLIEVRWSLTKHPF